MFELIKKVVDYLLKKEGMYLAEIADLKEKLAVALGNDASDAEKIAAAEAEAEAARQAAEDAAASLATAQETIAKDQADDANVTAFLQPLVDRINLEETAPPPSVDEAPVEDPIVVVTDPGEEVVVE